MKVSALDEFSCGVLIGGGDGGAEAGCARFAFGAGETDSSRNVPQKRHFFAAARMRSAQKGQGFVSEFAWFSFIGSARRTPPINLKSLNSVAREGAVTRSLFHLP